MIRLGWTIVFSCLAALVVVVLLYWSCDVVSDEANLFVGAILGLLGGFLTTGLFTVLTEQHSQNELRAYFERIVRYRYQRTSMSEIGETDASNTTHVCCREELEIRLLHMAGKKSRKSQLIMVMEEGW